MARLKAKATCRKCGQVGHWPNDPQCPKGRRKGKSKGSSSTSTASTTSSAPKGRGKGGQSKPRQVFFTINEYENDDEFEAKAHMVHGKEYSAVPPPSSLQHGSIVAGSSTGGHQDRLQKHLHSQGNPDAMLELAIQAAQAEALRIEREQKVPISPLVHRPLKEALFGME